MSGYIHCRHLDNANICPSWKQTPCVFFRSQTHFEGGGLVEYSAEMRKCCAYQCYNAFFLQIFWRNLVLWSSQEEREISMSFTSCYLEHQMKHSVRDNKHLHALLLGLGHTALHMTISLMHGVMHSWVKRRFVLGVFLKQKGKPWVSGPAAIVLPFFFTGPCPLLTCSL